MIAFLIIAWFLAVAALVAVLAYVFFWSKPRPKKAKNRSETPKKGPVQAKPKVTRKKRRKGKLSPAEAEEKARLKAEAEEEKTLFRAITREARFLAKVIPEHMAIQNRMVWNFHEYRRDGKGKRRKKSLIQFDVILLTRTEIWFKINGRKLPYGVSFSDIKKPENNVRANLQYAIHRPVMFYEDSEFNFFIRVGLKNSVMGIPRNVPWQKAFAALPKTLPFTVAVGINDHNKVVYQDLRKWPHGIIAGATGGGKSTQILQWLITMIKRNSPHNLKFIFVDLKEGIELGRFKDLPHTLQYVEEKAQVAPALQWTVNEYTRRMKMFKGKCQNITGWNATQKKKKKLPYIFFVVDEIADIMLDKALKAEAIEDLSKLARKARAAGIHVIVATQIVEAAVLPVQIRGNFPGRCVFSVPGNSESIMVLNNGMAVGLEPPGRCVYRHGSKHVYLQAPIATDDEIEAVIQEAITGKKTTLETFTVNDLFMICIHNLGGLASWRELYDACDGAMSQKKIKTLLKQHEFDFDSPQESIIELESKQYILSRSTKTAQGTQSRYLIPTNEKLPRDEDELIAMVETHLSRGATRGANHENPWGNDDFEDFPDDFKNEEDSLGLAALPLENEGFEDDIEAVGQGAGVNFSGHSAPSMVEFDLPIGDDTHV